jgi:crotonobetainyl-CoA:carnitine CoA-transferase CaiB-like acyl-CoA transferase
MIETLSSANVMQAAALQQIRVLDLTRIVAGPYTTRILADFGAEVIKIQTSRLAHRIESDATPYFCAWNRNKKSITLNLDHPAARELFLKLVRISDIVVENFSPRVMANWDLNYENLKKTNTQLIMLSMSGMGQSGPWQDYIAYGPTVQALGGLTYLTAYDPNEPMGLGYAYADMVAGLYGAIGVLAALEYRDQTGQGQHIDLSEYEAVCTTLGPALMDAGIHPNEIVATGNDDSEVPAAPYGCYRCSGEDRWCVVAIFSENQWQRFCSVLGNPAWAQSANFSSLPKRKKYSAELNHHIGRWTAGQTAEHAVERLQQAGVPAGVVQNAADLAQDRQLLSDGFFAALDHPVLGELKAETYPFKLQGGQPASWKASPLLGEDNQYVYGQLLGLSATQIRSYAERGIIA